MPTNYTIKRRIGSMLTNGSSQWTLFSQFGDEFLWSVPFTDVNAVVNPGTAAVTRTLTVPTGIAVQAKFSIMCVSTDTTPQQDTRVVVSSLDRSDQTPSPTTDSMGSFIASATGTGAATAEMTVRTNTSAQIRTRNSASSIGVNLNIGTIGWIDTRGKLS